MDSKQKQMLQQLMACGFTAVELNLFLDTHPDDRKALTDYNDTVKKYGDMRQQYESKYGPLTNFGLAPSQMPWQWVQEPWPWEINFY